MTAAIEFFLAVTCFFAAVFQVVTARHSSVRNRSLVRAGKRVMAAGFAFLAVRLFWLAFNDVAIVGILWGLTAIGLIAWGSIMVNCERVIDK